MQDQVADVGVFFDPIHGLWTPNEALFFYRNSNFLGLGRQFGQVNFGVFSSGLSAPILVL